MVWYGDNIGQSTGTRRYVIKTGQCKYTFLVVPYKILMFPYHGKWMVYGNVFYVRNCNMDTVIKNKAATNDVELSDLTTMDFKTLVDKLIWIWGSFEQAIIGPTALQQSVSREFVCAWCLCVEKDEFKFIPYICFIQTEQLWPLYFIHKGSVYLCQPTSLCKGVAEKPHVHRAVSPTWFLKLLWLISKQFVCLPEVVVILSSQQWISPQWHLN